MKNDQIIKDGEAFERLMASPDYEPLKRFVSLQIQTISSELLQPPFRDTKGVSHGAKSMEEVRDLQGQLIGLAMPESNMETIIKLMKKVKAELAKEAKAAEEKRKNA